MPVPYPLDESDSDSIVSLKLLPHFTISSFVYSAKIVSISILRLQDFNLSCSITLDISGLLEIFLTLI